MSDQPAAAPEPAPLTPEQEVAAIRAGYQGTKEKAEPATETAAGAAAPAPEKTEAAAPADEGEEEKGEEGTKEPTKDEEQAALRKQDDVIAGLQKQIRGFEARYGGLNDEVTKLRKALATAKTAASDSGEKPSQKQIAAALSNQAEMDKLTKDYPEFQPFAVALKEVHDLAAKASRTAPATPVQAIDPEVIKREAREMAKLDMKHEDWEDVINTDEFLSFALDGGPSRDDYAALQQLRNPNGTLQRGYLEKLNQIVKNHPQWWADKGAAFFSDKARDALRLLDAYKAGKEPAAPAAKPDKTKREERLRANLNPKGSGAAAAQSETFEDSIRRGYRQVAEKQMPK